MELSQGQVAFPGDVALATVREWTLWLTAVERRIGAQCTRRAARWHAGAYLRGLLSPVERKNSWQIAAINGETTPYGVQHLLGRAQWDAAALRDALRPSVIEPLGAAQAVLVMDETGCLKKGQHSAGVARQYRGPAGRVDQCQIGVFLTYASPQGHVLLDRELYLPKEWTTDAARCKGAGIPAARPFATKPQLAQQRLQRACDAGVPAAWVAGDRVYGENRSLRLWLEAHGHAHVLAVSGQEYVWRAGRQPQGKSVLAPRGPEGWDRLRAGDGANGPRWDDWPWLPLAMPLQPHWRRGLLVRRSLCDPTARTAYVVFAPEATGLETVVQVAGSRWTIERCFAEAKGEVGLEHDEGRSWTGWYRPITLAMGAYALLTVLRAVPLPAALPVKKMSQAITPRSLTAFKVARGRVSH